MKKTERKQRGTTNDRPNTNFYHNVAASRIHSNLGKSAYPLGRNANNQGTGSGQDANYDNEKDVNTNS